jgi:hypothetical protein
LLGWDKAGEGFNACLGDKRPARAWSGDQAAKLALLLFMAEEQSCHHPTTFAPPDSALIKIVLVKIVTVWEAS